MSEKNGWHAVKERFLHIAACKGIENVANAIPSGRDTVYRLIKGETLKPTRAVLAGIERIVAEHENREDSDGTRNDNELGIQGDPRP